MATTPMHPTYLFRFEAHKYSHRMQFVSLAAELSGGRYGLSVTDITDAFVNSELYGNPISDAAHCCFALDGSFALSVPVADEHPVVLALVAIGFSMQEVLDEIVIAVDRASAECQERSGDDE